ncbi:MULTISPECIES: helix-turn-helix domain-containing protein [Streptomyces]|uniref:Helix-turn-helix domain-containing protein n=1 Tax=Streptomyces harbinensis TaxID=1176198 RepID=A0A1I6TA02_9ACTN|nr:MULTISPECIES: helix-turn-helix transcriptional regulator [Streptomyces]QKV69592.1 helix-turn-helix domain-containing protein [Streptomyces harbinensis]SFS85943.1 Helix-turn-helix domain-containing protein [Streptomyces harbinensis]
MADESSQFPVSYRYFGSQFQLWRQNAQVRRETIAEAANYSVDTVKSVEQGRRRVPPRLAEIADEMFGARGLLLAGIPYLKRERYPERSRTYFEYENEAIAMWWYEPLLIPGLLQTEEYANALISGRYPPWEDDEAEEKVRGRLARRALLTSKPTVAFSFVLYEAVLRCPVGGDQALKEQLCHLVEVAKLRNVSIQVLPFERVVPSALNGPMVLLETRDHEHFALVEGQSLSQQTTAPTDVSTLTQRYGMIRTQALSEEESVSFIERMVEPL